MSTVANTGSCVGPQNKMGHPARRYTQLIQVPVLGFRGIKMGSKTRVIVFLGSHFQIVSIILILREKLVILLNMRCVELSVVVQKEKNCSLMTCILNN